MELDKMVEKITVAINRIYVEELKSTQKELQKSSKIIEFQM